MGYLLRMSAEIHDWLTDLRASDPEAARLVVTALSALMVEGASLGPPMVSSLADSRTLADSWWDMELLEALDLSYQRKLERLQIVRRGLADAVKLAEDVRLQIAHLESRRAKVGDDSLADGGADQAAQAAEPAEVDAQLAELRRLLPGVIESEQTLEAQAQRLQAQVDAFRVRKETLKARYIAARAELAVSEVIADLGQEVGDRSIRDEDPGPQAAAAADRFRQVKGEIERELRSDPAVPDVADLRPPPDLMELRPDAPGGSYLSILFGIEPPGTALLIAVLEGREAVRERHREAALLSSQILRQVRAGESPESAVHAFDDVRAFLDQFFPGEVDEIEIGAAAFVARNRGRTLAEQRVRLGLTQAQVAERMGVRQERVSAIERAEPGATEVRTLASYVEALGGRLEIIGDFGGDRVVLR